MLTLTIHMGNTKEDYRYLISDGKQSKMMTFRVPLDFPIDSTDLKLVVSEIDLIVRFGEGKKSNVILQKILKYYKDCKKDLNKKKD